MLSGLHRSVMGAFQRARGSVRLGERIEHGVQRIEESRDWVIKLVLDLVQLAVLCSVLLSSATLFYILLYQLLVPTTMHYAPIYFDFGEETRKAPTALVDFLAEHRTWARSSLASGRGHRSRLLAPGQKYDFVVALMLPQSPENLAVGMFMLDLQLQTSDSQVLAQSKRPLMLPHYSSIVRATRVLLLLLPLVFGVMWQNQKITTMCVDGFLESYEHPFAAANISLSHSNLQLSSASISIVAQLSGIRYYMYHYFTITAAIGIVVIAMMQGIVLLLIYLWFMPTFTQQQEPATPNGRGGAALHSPRGSPPGIPRGGHGGGHDGSAGPASGPAGSDDSDSHSSRQRQSAGSRGNAATVGGAHRRINGESDPAKSTGGKEEAKKEVDETGPEDPDTSTAEQRKKVL